MNEEQINKIFDGDWELAKKKMMEIEKLVYELKILHGRIEGSLRFALLDQAFPSINLPLKVDTSLTMDSSILLMDTSDSLQNKSYKLVLREET